MKPAEHGVLFSPMMVRMLLDGKKTMTRRIINPQPVRDGEGWLWRGGKRLLESGYGAAYVHSDRKAVERAMLTVCRYKPGDLIWVRETWADGSKNMPTDAKELGIPTPPGSVRWALRADYDNYLGPLKWTPGIFMPRWASRITLRIESIRVERLQEITEEDALAEGFDVPQVNVDHPPKGFKYGDKLGSHRNHFQVGWDLLNAERGYSWKKNPFVWVLQFRKL